MVREKYFLAAFQPHSSTQQLSTWSLQMLCFVNSWVLKKPFTTTKIKPVWERQTSRKLPDSELLNLNTWSLILLTLELPAVKALHNCLTKIVMQLVFKKTIKTTRKSMRISGLQHTHRYYKQEELPKTKQSLCIKNINCSDSIIRLLRILFLWVSFSLSSPWKGYCQMPTLFSVYTLCLVSQAFSMASGTIYMLKAGPNDL